MTFQTSSNNSFVSFFRRLRFVLQIWYNFFLLLNNLSQLFGLWFMFLKPFRHFARIFVRESTERANVPILLFHLFVSINKSGELAIQKCTQKTLGQDLLIAVVELFSILLCFNFFFDFFKVFVSYISWNFGLHSPFNFILLLKQLNLSCLVFLIKFSLYSLISVLGVFASLYGLFRLFLINLLEGL